MVRHPARLGALLLGLIPILLAAQSPVPKDTGERIAWVAECHLGIREHTPNWGPEIKEMLREVCIHQPAYWCGACAYTIVKRGGGNMPGSPCQYGWTPAWFNNQRLVWKQGRELPEIKPGYAFGLYYPSLKRIGHIGIIIKVEGSWIWTIEGNTSAAGSRNGQGVHMHHRRIDSIYAICKPW